MMGKLKRTFVSKQLLYLLVFLSLSLFLLVAPILLTSVSSGFKYCYSDWAEESVKRMVTEVLYKRGGLPQHLPDPTSTFFLVSPDYPLKQDSEEVLLWRLNTSGVAGPSGNPANLLIDLSEPFREPEFDIKSIVNVLYVDGIWHELEFSRVQNGYVSFCSLPPIPARQYGEPISYKILQSKENTSIRFEKSLIFGKQGVLEYQLYENPDKKWRIVTSQLNHFNGEPNLLEFAQYNDELGEQFINQQKHLDVQILFKSPIDPTTFKQLARESGLLEGVVYIQSMNVKGETITWPLELAGNLKNFEKINQIGINDNYMPDTKSKLSIQGIVAAVGTISSENYLSLRKHTDIFMIDVTPTLIREQILEQTGQPITESDIFGVIPLAFLEGVPPSRDDQ